MPDFQAFQIPLLDSSGSFLLVFLVLPLVFCMLVLLGLFLYQHGKSYLIEPKHSIRIALETFAALFKLHRSRLAKSKRNKTGAYTGEPNRTPPPPDNPVPPHTQRTGIGLPVADREIEDIAAPSDTAPRGLQPFPIHDAPLWVLSYLLVVITYLIFLGIDVWGTTRLEMPPYWLEVLLLGHMPILRHVVPLTHPLWALLFYLIVNYLFLLFLGHLLSRLMRVKQLHLMHEAHPLRRLVQKLWRSCGFIDFRVLDHSARLWFTRPVLLLGGIVVASDLLAFVNRITVAPGGLAVLHLFFVATVRMFDETWLYPVTFDHTTYQRHPKTPLDQLADNLYKNGFVSMPPEPIGTLDPARYVQRDAPVVELPPLVKDFLVSLCGSRTLWEHQAVAWKKVAQDGAGTILCGPSGSGKRTWSRIVAINEIIYGAGGSLLILPNRQRLKEAFYQLRNSIDKSAARWNLTVFDASSPTFLALDIAKHSPRLVLADPNSIDHVLLRHQDRFTSFWRLLSRIIVDEISLLSSVNASNFYYLLRRLDAVRARENSKPAALCGTCAKVSLHIEDEIEKLLGAPMRFVIADTAPAIPVKLYFIQPSAIIMEQETDGQGQIAPAHPNGDGTFDLSRPFSLVDRAVAGIRNEGHDVYIDASLTTRHETERAHTLGSWTPITGPATDHLHAATSVVLVDDHNLYSIQDDVRHFGMLSREYMHVCFLFLGGNPAVPHLLSSKSLLGNSPLNRTGAMFAFNPSNPLLIERHMEAAIDNAPMSPKQLRQIFGNTIVDSFLPEMVRDERIEEIQQTDHPHAGCYLLRDRRFPLALDADTIETPAIEIVCPSRKEEPLLLRGEARCVRSMYYPGRTFMCGAERFVITVPAKFDNAPSTIQAAAAEGETFTSKIRSIACQWEPTDRMPRRKRCNLPGGLPLLIGTVSGTVKEFVFGYNTWKAGPCLIHTVRYDHRPDGQCIEISGQYQMLAVSFECPDPPLPVLRLLVLLWRTIIPTLFEDPFDTPDVFISEPPPPVSETEKAVIFLRDLYPGGAGALNRHDAHQICQYLTLCRDMLSSLANIAQLLKPYDTDHHPLQIDDALVRQTIDFITSVVPTEAMAPHAPGSPHASIKTAPTASHEAFAVSSEVALPAALSHKLEAAQNLFQTIRVNIKPAASAPRQSSEVTDGQT